MSQRLVNQAADPFRLERLSQDVGRMDKTRGEVERDVDERITVRDILIKPWSNLAIPATF